MTGDVTRTTQGHGVPAEARPVSAADPDTRRTLALGALLAFGVGALMSLLGLGGHGGPALPDIVHWLRDSAMTWPIAVGLTAVAGRLMTTRPSNASTVLHRAVLIAGAYAFLTVPANAFHGGASPLLAPTGGWAGALKDAAAIFGPTVLVLLVAGHLVRWGPLDSSCSLQRALDPLRLGSEAGARRPVSVRSLATFLATAMVASLVPSTLAAVGGVGATPASAAPAVCTDGNANRIYNVDAVNVLLPFNRWGDIDKHGQIFVLREDREAVQHWAFPLGTQADGTPGEDVAGNRRLRPRPLVLRANEGECVQVNFHNALGDSAPVPPGAPHDAVPNPPPRNEGLPIGQHASIHVHGPSYDVVTSDGSHVGFNEDTTVPPGGSITYHWRAPDAEGLYFFHDEATVAGSEADGGSNAHGLFGALAVEPAGSQWIDPVSGARLDTGSTPYMDPLTRAQSGELYVNAIIVPPGSADYDGEQSSRSGARHAPDAVAFREFIQISQDEVPGQHLQEADLRDRGIDTVFGFGIGLGFNYGVEPLLMRQEPINRCPDCVGEETWLSSWPYGDPGLVKLADGLGPWYPSWHPFFEGNDGEQRPDRVADPEDCGLESAGLDGSLDAETPAPWASCYTANVIHAYQFDATKIRFAHAGPKETHVFHLHAHQWIRDADDVGASGSTPGQPDDDHLPESTTIDSQTYGPGETFTADVLFGAGSKPGTVGDSIFHCHLYPHFAEGFWSLWRVHDVLEDGSHTTPDGIKVVGILPLPDRLDPPAPPDEFTPGYPRFIPGEYGWRAPQPLNGVSEPDGEGTAPDVPFTDDALRLARRHVAGTSLDETLLAATQAVAITPDGATPPAGTFTLTFDGNATAAIPATASADAVRNALTALDSIADVQVTGSGTTADPWVVALLLWTRTDSLLLSADGAGLTGATVDVTPSRADLDDQAVAHAAHKLARERASALVLQNHDRSDLDPGQEGSTSIADPTLRQPKPGAPLVDPCPDTAREVTYNVSAIQLDLVYNEQGWHDPQGRILVLDEDVDDVLAGRMQPEPLFFRVNAGDCINFNLTNRLPNFMGNDDFLQLIQTNMIGQHIHLVKFDVTGSDGASNGWNYQQAAYSEDQRRFDDAVLAGTAPCGPDTFDGLEVADDGCRVETPSSIDPEWSCGSTATCPVGQTIHERWYADYELRTVFTHDHHFPAEDQNRGYFSALVVEPRGMDVRNSFTGEFMQPRNDGSCPVSVGCEGNAVGTHVDVIGPGSADDFREYGIGVQDFVSLYRPCPSGEACSPFLEGQQALEPPLHPEEFPDDDPGQQGINYRNAPFVLRDDSDPAYIFSSRVHGDPQTPVLKAYAGDPVRMRVIHGAQEEQHVVQIHGMRWREETEDPGSRFVNAQSIGISEAFNFEIPAMVCSADPEDDCRGDYLYSGTATDDLYLGAWGIMRVFGKGVNGLLPLPDNRPQAANGNTNLPVTGDPPPKANKPGTPCPANAPVRAFDVIAVDARITYNRYGDHDPFGLVYAVVEPGETVEQAAARVRASNPEPMVLRANEGDCLEVTLTNMIDPDGDFARRHAPLGSRQSGDGFDPPLPLEPSAGTPAGLRVSLHPQLLLYDVRGSDGATIGHNRDQTVGPRAPDSEPGTPGESILYRWYADDVSPGEIGAVNLTDYGDVRGHRHHGLFAGLVIGPKRATYHDPVTGREVLSATQADARIPGAPDFRDAALFFQDGLNLWDASGENIPDMLDHPPTPEEPAGVMPDAEDRGEKGFNYRNAPFHHRLGEPAGAALDGLDGGELASVFSSVEHGDPDTPIIRAYAGDPVRIRLMQGADKPRQHGFQMSGQAWRRQPLDDPDQTDLVGTTGGFSVGQVRNLHLTAGGAHELPGDARYNTALLSNNLSGGLWGIARTYPQPDIEGPIFVPTSLAGIDDDPRAGGSPILPLEWTQVKAGVFADDDADGNRGKSEPPRAGIRIDLKGLDGTIHDSRVTDDLGTVAFQAAPGAYDVELPVTDPSDGSRVLVDHDPTTPTSFRADATTQAEFPYGEFGVVELADITLDLFLDRDGDNIHETEEPGLEGWQVTASKATRSHQGTTGPDGLVALDGLWPGTWTITVAARDGLLSTRDQNGNGVPDRAEGVAFTVDVPVGASLTPASVPQTAPDPLNAGYTPTSGLKVRLFNDADDDGGQDATEQVLAGWQVQLQHGDGVVVEGCAGAPCTATSDADGLVDFGDSIAGGPYVLAISPPDPSWEARSARTVETDLVDGSTSTRIDTCGGTTCAVVFNGGSSNVTSVAMHTDNVWVVVEPFNDTDNDDVRDGKEKKLVGWTASLFVGTSTTATATTTVGNDGRAVFVHAPPVITDGERVPYRVELTQPADSALDWAPTPATTTPPGGVQQFPIQVTGAPGETLQVRKGFIQLGTVAVSVFHDLDRDGAWDGNEPPLGHRNVRLLSRNGKTVLATGATDTAGYRPFQVAAGTDYQLEVLTPSGWVATAPLTNSGKATTRASTTSSSDPTRSVDPIEFGQFQVDDTTPPPAPVPNPGPGEYGGPQNVSLSSETGATIRYTLDGSTPSATAGQVYSAPIAISTDATLKAVAIDQAGNVSSVTTAAYSFTTGGGGGASATASVWPSTWSVDKGTQTSGTVAALHADDASYVVTDSARKGKNQAVWATGTATTTHTDATALALTIDAHASRATDLRLQLWNVRTGGWETVQDVALTTGDTTHGVPTAGDVARFIATNGDVRLRLVAEQRSAFTLKVDLIELQVTYPSGGAP